jgi:cell division cycle 14
MSFIPFRDASQGEADHGLSMQDVIWGVWKAVQYGLLSLEDDFDAEAYEVSSLVIGAEI